MTDARATILSAIARATPRNDPAAIAAEAAALVAAPDSVRPGFDRQSLRRRFVAKATSAQVTATVEEIAKLAEVPQAAARYLGANHLEPRLALQPRPTLSGLDWGGLAIHVHPAPDEPAALTIADMGIAETGSVVFRSSHDAPVLMNFLPLHHIVVLFETTLVPYPEDVFARLGTRPADQPRSLNIVTGTSGTADIEAKNVRGAHGPRFMHVILVAPPRTSDFTA